ncbi:hypothetical protein ACTA71_006733 [Dictyostelium dimigraforme]
MPKSRGFEIIRQPFLKYSQMEPNQKLDQPTHKLKLNKRTGKKYHRDTVVSMNILTVGKTQLLFHIFSKKKIAVHSQISTLFSVKFHDNCSTTTTATTTAATTTTTTNNKKFNLLNEQGFMLFNNINFVKFKGIDKIVKK